jgi:hypothetical protein
MRRIDDPPRLPHAIPAEEKSLLQSIRQHLLKADAPTNEAAQPPRPATEAIKIRVA